MAFKALISLTTVPLKLCLFIDGLDEYEGIEEDIAELFGKASMSDNVKICCSTTGMFTLPKPMSHVSSAALAQARLKPGSSSAQVCSGLLRSTYPYYATRLS